MYVYRLLKGTQVVTQDACDARNTIIPILARVVKYDHLIDSYYAQYITNVTGNRIYILYTPLIINHNIYLNLFIS